MLLIVVGLRKGAVVALEYWTVGALDRYRRQVCTPAFKKQKKGINGWMVYAMFKARL